MKVIGITKSEDNKNYLLTVERNDGLTVNILVPTEDSDIDLKDYDNGPFGLNLVTSGHYR